MFKKLRLLFKKEIERTVPVYEDIREEKPSKQVLFNKDSFKYKTLPCYVIWPLPYIHSYEKFKNDKVCGYQFYIIVKKEIAENGGFETFCVDYPTQRMVGIPLKNFMERP